MTPDPLDNPAWAALNEGQRELGEQTSLAAVYHRQVSPLAGLTEVSDAALAALASVVAAGSGVAVLNTRPEALPETPHWQPIQRLHLHQMVCETPPREIETFATLGATDVPDMLALATATEPGPFLERTVEMGRYVGVRQADRLLAMAGERMKPPGWIEISGVCTHPDGRGNGYASRLVATLLNDCFAAGQRAFLHVVVGSPSEAAATAVYKAQGFRHRRDMFAHVLVRQEVS